MASRIQRFVQGNTLMTKMWPAICHQFSSPIEDKLLVAGKHRQRAQKMPVAGFDYGKKKRYAAYKEVILKHIQILIFSTGFQGILQLYLTEVFCKKASPTPQTLGPTSLQQQSVSVCSWQWSRSFAQQSFTYSPMNWYNLVSNKNYFTVAKQV